MERLSTPAAATQDTSLALCYQLNQPINVQAVDSQTAVAVQSLLDSQVVTEPQDEDEDIFQCGKCKKQFTTLSTFVGHKQTQCVVQQTQQPTLQLQPHQTSQIALGTGSSAFASTINLNRPFSQSQIHTGVSNVNTSAPILQAHPCLTRSLNQPTNGQTLTLSGVPSSPISQMPQNMVFTDELLALTNLDTSSIQMVTAPLHGQAAANNPNGMTIFSPITNLTGTANAFTPTAGPTGQLLVQPTQHITLTAIADNKGVPQQHPQQLQQQQQQQQQQPPQLNQTMRPPPPPLPPPSSRSVTITASSQHANVTTTLHPGVATAQHPIQQQMFKPSPTKAGRKSAQNNFITVLNPDNSVSLLSTRKGRTARNANSSADEDEANGKPKLQCEYCGKQFTKNFDLQQHVRAHTGEKPFQCIVCGRAFAQKSNVKKHMATHKVWPGGTSNTLPKQPEPTVEMDNTDVVDTIPEPPSMSEELTPNMSKTLLSQQKENLGSHRLEEEGVNAEVTVKVVVDNSYMCKYCPAKFKTYYQLKTHLVTHKSEQVYKCVMKKCGHSFHDLDTFLSHMRSHENEMSYRCHQCHKYFKSLYDLGVHQYSHVYMNQSVKAGPRHFQCTKCGNKYTTPEALEHHMSTTSHDYKCPHCSKQFSCERFLRRHLPIHGSEGQFECGQCKKRFKTEHYLKSHVLIHTGETPFSCSVCQAAFNRKDKLKRHMTIHDAIKKYRCPFRSIAGCTKEFNRPDKLKAHIITHSGIKPYKCSICSKSFSRRPHLVEHERGHNSDFRFKCDKCGKGFFRPKLFNEHKCQPSRAGVEQHFRPRNRRKLGRPRKRMITITPDSIAKSRGKQYMSRTRGKGKTVPSTAQIIAKHLSAKQQQRLQRIKGKQSSAIASSDPGQIDLLPQHGGQNGQQEQNTLSVEVVKALPVLTTTGKMGDRLSAQILGLEGVKEEGVLGAEVLGASIQQISLGPGGELVDHYVVHLTESMDGSAPTIQTAFIPAVSGSQIFANASAGVGIQPIAIIEASSLNMATSDMTGTEILTADGSGRVMASSAHGHQLQLQKNSPVGGQGLVAIANHSQSLSAQGSLLKSELDDTALMVLPGEKCEAATTSVLSSSSSDVLVGGHSTSGMEVGVSCGVGRSVGSGGLPGDPGKEDAVMVIGNDGMMIGGTEMVAVEGEEGSDMMGVDSSLSFFPNPASSEGYVERQVVVSGGQAFIACSAHLMEYTTADTGLHDSNIRRPRLDIT